VTNCAGGAAEQGGGLRAGLGKAEDVINEEQDVLVLFVAEIFCDGEAREGDTEAGAGWFVHLAIDQRDFGFSEIILLDDTGLGHFVVEIIALAAAFTNTGEDGDTTMELGDIVNELHNDDGFADARTPES